MRYTTESQASRMMARNVPIRYEDHDPTLSECVATFKTDEGVRGRTAVNQVRQNEVTSGDTQIQKFYKKFPNWRGINYETRR